MDCEQLTAGAATVFLQTWTHGAGIQTEAPEATGVQGAGPGALRGTTQGVLERQGWLDIPGSTRNDL